MGYLGGVAMMIWMFWGLAGRIAVFCQGAAPAALGMASGRIEPTRNLIWVFLGAGAFVMLSGAAVLWGGPKLGDVPVARLLILIPPPIMALIALPLGFDRSVRWNAGGIEGPSGWFPWPGRNRIAWQNVVHASNQGMIRYVEARGGRRVYWSQLYQGFPALHAAVRSHRSAVIADKT